MSVRSLAVTAGISYLSIFALTTAQAAPVGPIITDPVYTKAAQLVDVGGGRRINLYCRGTGSPAVIFDSGLSDSTIAWALVQPTISKKNKTCSYDRAGLGFSDATTRPSTASNDVDDIHRALQVVGVRPPYIVVGHSAGGMAVRVFADRYRDEVVGMVLVDPSHEDQTRRLDAIKATEGPAPNHNEQVDRTCLDALDGSEIPKASPVYMQCVGKPDSLYSQAINDAMLGYAAKRKYQEAVASEWQNVGGASADQTRATRRHFGDMPIIVLGAPYPRWKTFTQEQMDKRNAMSQQLHHELAAMSTRGVYEFVPQSSHLINYDRPETVIDAIRQALVVSSGKPLHADTECASIFQAAEVARNDFADRLKHEKKAGTDLDSFVENLDNYSIGISTESGSYFVIFKLRKMHRVIFGGVANYEIRKKDLAILRFHQEE